MGLNSKIRLKPQPLQADETLLGRKQVEQALGHALPDLLIELLGPTMTPCCFDPGVGVKPFEPDNLTRQRASQTVLVLFGLSSGRDGIARKYADYAQRIGPGLVPIAGDGLDNLFVFEPASGAVYFWHHEGEDAEASPASRRLVSDSFAAFIDALDIIDAPPDPDRPRAISVNLRF